MITESTFRLAFAILIMLLFVMRVFFMIKVRLSGGKLIPDRKAVEREGGRGILILRIVFFFLLIAFLVMCIIRSKWIDVFLINLPSWLRWLGFGLGFAAVLFWTWTQVTLDTQWSAQLQLTQNHHLITTGPYTHIRHPLYASVFGWCVVLSLLTANWIFIAVCALSIIGLLWRIPKEEQMMIDAFGDEYRTYMKHSGRIFPKIKGIG